jgi:hypothetical protein
MNDSLTSLAVTRRHESKYWSDSKPEWLPRDARFDVQVGPAVQMAARLWRELVIELGSGPGFLYRYFPFACYVYVNERPAVILEFDEPSQRLKAIVRVPIGEAFSIRIVTELGSSPAGSGHGNDTRELALLLYGMAVGSVVAEPRPVRPAPAQEPGLSITATPQPVPEPVFVVGAYRSATSVLTWAIGQHPNIWPMEESGWLPLVGLGSLAAFANATTAARNFFEVYDSNQGEFMTHMGRAVDAFCQNVSRRHLQGILLGRLSGNDKDFNPNFQLARTVMNPKRRWVDGTPENSGYIIALRQLFPNAKFVGLIRNPLDVVASMLRFDRAGGEKTGVKDAATMWLNMTRWVLKAYQAYGPDVVMPVAHERLIADPAATLASIFEFLGEPNFPKAADTFGTRINSSKVASDERQSLYAEIDNEPDVKAELLQLYDEARAAIAQPWQYDNQAETFLTKALNDWVARMGARRKR